MHISVNVGLQIFITLLHMGNILLPVVPPARKPLVMALLGIGNVAVSTLAHYSNPDGTPAWQAWADAAPVEAAKPMERTGKP